MLSHIIQNCHIDLAALADPLDLLRGLDHVVIRNLVSGIRRLHQLLIKCLMAMFVLLSTSARAWIVWINLLLLTLFRCTDCAVIFVCSGYFCNLFSLHFLLNLNVEQCTDRVFSDCICHFTEHLISCHLVLYQWISLSISLKTDSLTQLIHIIDMIHPSCINHFQKYNTLNFAKLLCLRELCFFVLISLHSTFFQKML